MAMLQAHPDRFLSPVYQFKKKEGGGGEEKNVTLPLSYVSLAVVPTHPNLPEKKISSLLFFNTSSTKVFVEENVPILSTLSWNASNLNLKNKLFDRMIKQLLNSGIANYRDLSASRRSII